MHVVRRSALSSARLAVAATVSLVAGVVSGQADPYPEWTLFSPTNATTTFMVDLDGDVVHTWPSTYTTGHAIYLLDEGRILRSGRDDSNGGPSGGGAGGRLQIIAWDGTLEWDYQLADPTKRHHHDALPLPNGNVLAIVWEVVSLEDLLAAGRDPDNAPPELWSEAIYEIEPVGLNGGNVVWTWRAFDHLVQNFDPDKPNYGEPSDHPERIDINFPPGNNRDWLHFNGLDYNAELDQILLSSNFCDEIWIISHAPGDSGELLYRWGNPAAWDAGDVSDQRLFNQHNPQWIEPGLPGEGNILLYNNGNDRPDGVYSTLDELVPPLLPDGTYARDAGEPFGPDTLEWTCDSIDGVRFYSRFISGVQRLPNGHTFTCVGAGGRFVEMEETCVSVWEYTSPFGPNVFRAERFGARDLRLEGLLWCLADFDGDGEVNTLDVLAFLNAWSAGDLDADVNGDGDVNTLDVLAFLNAWGEGCG